MPPDVRAAIPQDADDEVQELETTELLRNYPCTIHHGQHKEIQHLDDGQHDAGKALHVVITPERSVAEPLFIWFPEVCRELDNVAEVPGMLQLNSGLLQRRHHQWYLGVGDAVLHQKVHPVAVMVFGWLVDVADAVVRHEPSGARLEPKSVWSCSKAVSDILGARRFNSPIMAKMSSFDHITNLPHSQQDRFTSPTSNL